MCSEPTVYILYTYVLCVYAHIYIHTYIFQYFSIAIKPILQVRKQIWRYLLSWDILPKSRKVENIEVGT
jgi:hypothetical protein